LTLPGKTYEEENKMPYRTSDERIALEEGRKEELLDEITLAVEPRFGEAGTALARDVRSVSDLNKLREIMRAALRGETTIDQLRSMLK
jgi:hypothetical protein